MNNLENTESEGFLYLCRVIDAARMLDQFIDWSRAPCSLKELRNVLEEEINSFSGVGPEALSKVAPKECEIEIGKKIRIIEERHGFNYVFQGKNVQDRRERYSEWVAVDQVISMVEAFVSRDPYDELSALASMIDRLPWGGYISIMSVATAAAKYAFKINDESTPTSYTREKVGNAWLHQLGIILMHSCYVKEIPPPEPLIDLMAAVGAPPNQIMQSSKARRMIESIRRSDSPIFAHEAEPINFYSRCIMLELLGYADANRQSSYFVGLSGLLLSVVT